MGVIVRDGSPVLGKVTEIFHGAGLHSNAIQFTRILPDYAPEHEVGTKGYSLTLMSPSYDGSSASIAGYVLVGDEEMEGLVRAWLAAREEYTEGAERSRGGV